MLYNKDSNFWGITHGHTANLIQDPKTGRWVYVTSDKFGVGGDKSKPVGITPFASLGSVDQPGTAKNATRAYESAIRVTMTADQATSAINEAYKQRDVLTRDSYEIDPNRSRGQWNCATLPIDILNAGGAGFRYGDQQVENIWVYNFPSSTPQQIEVHAGNRPPVIFEINQDRGTVMPWGNH